MIGEVRHIDAAYLQSWLVGTHWGDWRTRGALAVAAFRRAWQPRRARRRRHPHPRLRLLRRRPEAGLRALPPEGLRQGGGRPHRRLWARRQRQLHHVDRVRRRRARHRAREPLGDRLRQCHEARRVRHAGRAGDLVREREDGPARSAPARTCTRRPGGRWSARRCRTPTRPSSTPCGAARRWSRASAAPPSCSTCSTSPSSRIGWGRPSASNEPAQERRRSPHPESARRQPLTSGRRG